MSREASLKEGIEKVVWVEKFYCFVVNIVKLLKKILYPTLCVE